MNEPLPKWIIVKNCLICGKELYTNIYKIEHGSGKYCSRTCFCKSRLGIKFPYKPRPSMKGRIIWNKGMRGQYHFSKQIVEKMRERMLGKNNPAYKNGLSRTDRAYINEYRKKYWHEHGLSKKYISDCNISKSKEYKAAQRHKRRALEFNGGDLTIQVIQKVYEDNIKKYGTLTCYLCLDPIQFKNDHLEHKTPLSRGGTNNQNNLDVACQRCNCKKNDKTVEEYSAYLLKERNLQS